jgi:hypothetical protein
MADELSDDEFEKRYGPKPAQADPQLADTQGRDLTDPEFENRYGPKAQPVSTDKQLYGEAAPWVDYFKDRWASGEAGITRGVKGMQAIQGGVQYEAIQHDANEATLKSQPAPFQQNVGWDTAKNWVGTAVESLPFMLETAKGSAKGAAVGAGIGAGTAFVAGQLGPQIAVPEEIATVPAGAALGMTWGSRIGAFTTSSKIMAGQLYLDLRDKGISHDTARTIGVAGGAVEGLLEAAQLGKLTSVARMGFVNQLRTAAGKNALLGFVKEYVKDVGVEVSEEELQSITELLSQGVAGYVDKNPNAVPNSDEIKKKLLDTFLQSAQASTLLVGGANVVGSSAGVATKAGGQTLQSISTQLLRHQQVTEAVQTAEGIKRGGEVATGLAQRLANGRMNIQQAMTLLAGAVNQAHPTEAQKEEVRNTDVGKLLDELVQPSSANTEQAPLVGRILKTMGEALDPTPQKETNNQEGKTLSYQKSEGVEYADAPDMGNPISLPETQLPTPELQARAKQVDSDIADLDAQIRDTQKLVDDRDVPGRTQARDAAQAEYDGAVRRAERLEKKFNDKEARGTDSQAVLDKLEESYQAEKDALARLKKAERVLAGTDPTKTATAALQNKLDKLYNQRSTLETERALLSEGLLSPEEIKKAQVKMTAGQVTAMRALAVKRILAAFKKGAKEGVRFTRGEIASLQSDVVSLIRESELTGKDKGKFLATVKNIQTEAQLLRSLPKIQARIDQLVDAEKRRQIKRQLKRLLEQTKLQQSGKRPVSKFGSADTQKVLDIYRKALEDPDWRYEAISRNIETLSANVEKQQSAIERRDPTIADYDTIPDKDILETLIAQRIGDYENKSVEDQQDILDEIAGIIAGGRAEKIEQKLAAAEERKAAIVGAMESINGVKPVDSLNPANSKLALNTLQNKLRRASLDRYINSWDGLLFIISQHDQQNKIQKIASVQEAIRIEPENQKIQRERLVDTLLKSVDKNKKIVLDRIVSGSEKGEFGAYTNQDGETVKLYVSRNEAIKLWNQMHDPDLEAGLKHGNQYTFPEDVSNTQKSTYELLDEALTPDDKNLAAGLTQFYREYYDRVNPEWEDETGASLERNENYSGYARRHGSPETGSASFFQEQFSRSSVKPASTISRVQNARGVDLSDAFIDSLKHIQDFEHWIAWRKTDKIIRAIFANQDIRNAIELKYGLGMMRTLDDRYNDMIGTRQDQMYDALKWMDRIRLNAGTAFVGGKLITGFKQMSAMANFLLDVSPLEMAEGLADFALHPKRAIETMESSPLLQARVETFDRDLMEALTRTDIKAFKTTPKLRDILMWATKYGDRATVWAGGWAVYKANLKKTGDHEQAIRAFEKSFNSTQQSGTPDSMSQLERSGQFGKILTLFVKQNLQMLEREANSIRKVMALPTLENARKAAKNVAVIHASAMLFQAVGSAIPWAFGDDDEKKEEEVKLFRSLILGPVAGLGLLGDTVNASVTVVTNWAFDAKERIWQPKFLPAEVATNTLKLFKDVFDGLTKDGIDAEDFFRILKDYSRGPDLLLPPELGGGLPKEPAIKFAQWLVTGETKDKPKRAK